MNLLVWNNTGILENAVGVIIAEARDLTLKFFDAAKKDEAKSEREDGAE